MTHDLPRLPRYGDLTIHGTTLAELASVIGRHLTSGWSRADDMEATWAERGAGGDRPLVFRHEPVIALPGALLYLFEQDAGVLSVSNVVPTKVGQLTEPEFNALLLDFHDNVVQGAVREVGGDASVDVSDYDLGERAGSEVQESLVWFSRGANRSTGTSHPYDGQRFDDFVIAASRLAPNLRPGANIIAEWLVADGWSEDTAYDLAIQYERGLRLLDRAASHG